MKDYQFDNMISKSARRIQKELAKEIDLTADALASDPEVIEYFKNEDIPGWKKKKMRMEYIKDSLYEDIERFNE